MGENGQGRPILEAELSTLLTPNLLANAKEAKVVWAKVKGYPAWPAQVLTEAGVKRRKDLAQERHSKGNSVPVMFFGTIEVAWVKDTDVFAFKEGLDRGYFAKNKSRPFRLALEQVRDFLAPDGKRKAPQKWWCKPPSNDADDDNDVPVQKSRPDAAHAKASASGAKGGSGKDGGGAAVKKAGKVQPSPRSSRGPGSSSDDESGSSSKSSSSSEESDEEEQETDGSSDSDTPPAPKPVKAPAVAKPPTGKHAPGTSAGPAKPKGPGALAVKAREPLAARPSRENGSSAASSAASAQPKKPPVAPSSAPGRPPRPPGHAAASSGAKDAGRTSGGAAAGAPAPPVSAPAGAGTVRTTNTVKDSGNEQPPRKRLKVEPDEQRQGPASSAAAIPAGPPAADTDKAAVEMAERSSHLPGLLPVSPDTDVFKLPAEIRRLAGIRLPALPKKAGPKAEPSPKQTAPVKAEAAAATRAASAAPGAMAEQMAVDGPVVAAPEETDAMEVDDTGARPCVAATSAEHKAGVDGRRAAAEQSQSSSAVESRGKAAGERSSKGTAAQSSQVQEESSSEESAESDESELQDSDASEAGSDEGAKGAAATGGVSRKAAAAAKGVRVRNRMQVKHAAQQQRRVRDHRAEKERRMARLAAPQPADRRCSARLAPRPAEAAAPSVAGKAPDSAREEGRSDDDGGSSSSTSASGSASPVDSDGEGEHEVKVESAAAADSGRHVQSGTVSPVAVRSRSQSRSRDAGTADNKALALGGPSLLNVAADRARSGQAGRESGRQESAARSQAAGDDSRGRHARSEGVSIPGPKPLPLELRRIQDSNTFGQAVETSERRSLRDRPSPARKGTVPAAVAAAPPGVAMTAAARRAGKISHSGSGAHAPRGSESVSPPDRAHGADAGQDTGKASHRQPQAQPADGLASRAASGARSGSPPRPGPVACADSAQRKAPSHHGPTTSTRGDALQVPDVRPAQSAPCNLVPSAPLVPEGASGGASTTTSTALPGVDRAVCPRPPCAYGPPLLVEGAGTLARSTDAPAVLADAGRTSAQFQVLAPTEEDDAVVRPPSPSTAEVVGETRLQQGPKHDLGLSAEAQREQQEVPPVDQPMLDAQDAAVSQLIAQREAVGEHLLDTAHQHADALGQGHKSGGEPRLQLDADMQSAAITEAPGQLQAASTHSADAIGGHASLPVTQIPGQRLQPTSSESAAQLGRGSTPSSPGRQAQLCTGPLVEQAYEAPQQQHQQDGGTSGSAGGVATVSTTDVAPAAESYPPPFVGPCPDAMNVDQGLGTWGSTARASQDGAPAGGHVVGDGAGVKAGSAAAIVAPGIVAPTGQEHEAAVSGSVNADGLDAAQACARELEELGEIAAALTGLQQADVPAVPTAAPVLVPAAVPAVPDVPERPRSRPPRAPARDRSATPREHTAAAALQGFRWPQAEPLLPATEQPFSLPREWLGTRPPRFEPIKRSLYLSRAKPKRLPKDEISVCACRAPPLVGPGEYQRLGCGVNCLNRLSSVLCDAKLCPCGELCNNKSLHLMRGPKTEVFLTENRGWGVRALEPLTKGAFIVEYTGEVIDERELQRRMEHARMNGEPHFYMMELSAGIFIDARRKGNIARLFNSSCEPNCETQKWHDAATGEVRVGIFATREIVPGEELTYDYFFSTYGALKHSSASFICMCGSKNCRGTMDLHPEKRRDLGRRLEVFWDADGQYYRAMVLAFHPTSRKHTIMYEDGGREKLNLEEVPHRWLDDDSPIKNDSLRPQPVVAKPSQSSVSAQQHAAAAQPPLNLPPHQCQQQPTATPPELLANEQLPPVMDGALGAGVAESDAAGATSVASMRQPSWDAAVAEQPSGRPPLGPSAADAAAQVSGSKHALSDSEVHLPLKKRQRAVAQSSQGEPPQPLGSTGRAQSSLQQLDDGAASGAERSYRSGGGIEEGSGVHAAVAERSHEVSPAHGTVDTGATGMLAGAEETNEELEDLLEAAEAVAALRTAPIGGGPTPSHSQSPDAVPSSRLMRGGPAPSANGVLVQTARVASPRRMLSAQRAGPPAGLPVVSRSGLGPTSSADHGPAAGGRAEEPAGYGQDQYAGSLQPQQQQSRNGTLAYEPEASDGEAGGNGFESDVPSGIDRENLLWRLVGIEKPKDLLPLFRINGHSKNGHSAHGKPYATHPYGSLLRALETSELMPKAEQLRAMHAQMVAAHAAAAQQQQQQVAVQPQQQVLPVPQLPALPQAPAPQAATPQAQPHQSQPQAPQPPAQQNAAALSAWHLAVQQHAAHALQHQHQQQSQPQPQPQHQPNPHPPQAPPPQQQQAHSVTYLPAGLDAATAASVAALLHAQQQHVAAAAVAAAAAAAGQHHLHTAHHLAQQHQQHQAQPQAHSAAHQALAVAAQQVQQAQAAAAAAAPAAAAALAGTAAAAHQQAAAVAAQWQHAHAHHAGQVMQDILQMYLAQQAAPQQALPAIPGAAAAGGAPRA